MLTQGPVAAIMRVHTDLFHYGGGVYQLSGAGRGRLAGHHSVRILGWGATERGELYWTLANSWGTDWGEAGLMRIRYGSVGSPVNNNNIQTRRGRVRDREPRDGGLAGQGDS